MKNRERIRGIIAPILTPMDEKEEVSEKELRNQINRLIENGIGGIFAFGTNGEGYILSEEEKEKILSIVIEETDRRVPVYVGTGCISTRDTIRLSKKAEEMGADVLSIITPSFAAASQEELYEHYKAVAEEVHVPIVLYNIPARTGNALAPDTVKRLSEIEQIVGVKDSSGNFDNMLQYIEKTREMDFAVLSGNDSLILWNLLAGGTGGIAGCANVFPQNMAGIYQAFQEGNIEQARKYQDNIREFRSLFRYGNPNTVVKTAVELLGYPVGKCRRPFAEIVPEGMEKIREVLKKYEREGIC
ncbi:MAG: 4-hydroxy-tetrahydrodipicolinate synthase [Bacillota bacterium]|nr:4-hydroxy-tetrahydrodipicolinate synthase [Bacillota bacterium]